MQWAVALVVIGTFIMKNFTWIIQIFEWWTMRNLISYQKNQNPGEIMFDLNNENMQESVHLTDIIFKKKKTFRRGEMCLQKVFRILTGIFLIILCIGEMLTYSLSLQQQLHITS